jgi:hypothetical protein
MSPDSPLPSASCLSFSVFRGVSPVELSGGRGGEGVGEEQNPDDGEKAWSSVNHSKLSVRDNLTPISGSTDIFSLSWEWDCTTE